MAVTKGDTHQRSVRKVRAEMAARADGIRPGSATSDGGDEEVVVMTSIQVGAPEVGVTEVRVMEVRVMEVSRDGRARGGGRSQPRRN
ncbi:MAG: hypothetical protein ACRDRS_04680 [Pseudonocardiaceae bacterium]